MAKKKHNEFCPRGFTLIELMVVLAILGLLVTLAINQFYGPRDQAQQREAEANLQLIAAAEKTFRMETNMYSVDASATNAVMLNSNLVLMLPTIAQGSAWNYKVITSGAGFLAKAGRVADNNATALCISDTITTPYKNGCAW